MSSVEKLTEKVKIGQSIFEKLFKLNDSDLKEKLLEILEEYGGDELDILKNNPDCTRVIKNEKPVKITFNYYDSIRVDWQGISYVPEHGSDFLVVSFNKFFKYE